MCAKPVKYTWQNLSLKMNCMELKINRARLYASAQSYQNKYWKDDAWSEEFPIFNLQYEPILRQCSISIARGFLTFLGVYNWSNGFKWVKISD